MVRIGFLTCVFLIALRLAIGWHFFFEGYTKYESTQKEGADANRPFSSASYFSGAQGPISSEFREFFGDPDTDTLNKLKLVDAGDDKPVARMPAALAKEWDEYLKNFIDEYKLDEADRKLAETRLEQSKADYVRWLTKPPTKLDDNFRNDEKAKKQKKSVGASNYEIPDNPQQRVLDYQTKLVAIREALQRVNTSFGKDVEKSHLTTLRNEAVAMRTSLQQDIGEQTQKFKDSLAKLVGERLAGFSYGKPDSMLVDDRVLELITLQEGPTDPAAPADQLVKRMPVVLDKQWNDYVAYARQAGKESLRKDVQRFDQMVADEKLRFVRYLLDFDEYTGGKALDEKKAAPIIDKYREAVTQLRQEQERYRNDANLISFLSLAKSIDEANRYRALIVAEIARRTDVLKQNLGGFKDSGYRGITEVEKPKTRLLGKEWPTTRQEWIDWATRWGLLVGGGCILIGLFTRLACFGCALFLVTEYLLNTPFPWLPTSPRAEGSYFFINKNVVEALALFVLATLPTGRWFGLDAILSRIWPFRSRSSSQAA